jgi:uncharacterized membrane protein YbhN (UPF0104 family)
MAVALGRRRAVAIGGPIVAAGVLGLIIAGRRHEFMHALHLAPVWLLIASGALQLVALLARSEAWNVCVDAAGATVSRRRLYRAAGLGGLASVLNGQLAVAARIAVLRRSAPEACPRVPALIAAELPILSVEAMLAALTSFTLIGPLGLPWWAPPICLGATGAVLFALRTAARRRTEGFWSGLAALRTLDGRGRRIVGLVLIAVFAQIARNWLALHALGVNASVLDAIAVLIAMVTLSQLPLGPSVGAAAVVLILGAQGVPLTAAGGVLLTATGTAGALCYAVWAVGDGAWEGRRQARLA